MNIHQTSPPAPIAPLSPDVASIPLPIAGSTAHPNAARAR